MQLQELFATLSAGVLSNLNYGTDGEGTIQEQYQPKLVLHINEGLTRLHSRFVLMEKDVMIEMQAHITNYHLKKEFAESGWNPEEEHFPYIKDLPDEPFTEDVIKILGVCDMFGTRLPINDAEAQESFYTPQANVLQIPRPRQGVCVSVMYQARHPRLTPDDLEAEVVLPEVLEEALCEYVAYKVYANMNSDTSTIKGQEHKQAYEALCVEATERDLVSTSVSTTNTRFRKRGWV